MGDYFQHWLDIGETVEKKPRIFNVNWFRLDDDGNFIWPGFGDNLRVIDWIIDRCEDKIDAVQSPIGYLPKPEDINIEGLNDVTLDTVKELLSVDTLRWQEEAAGIEEFYRKFGNKLPENLINQLNILKQNLNK
jgi:phosphoenolpyruvate carboxykinase (GTP)